MKFRLIFIVAAMFVLNTSAIFAQQGAGRTSDAVAFWVGYWAQPRVLLFGAEQESFHKNMRDIFFPWDEASGPTDPSALEQDIQWLKNHPTLRFYVEGYASSRGELTYNLALSQRRANWVKQVLIDKGVPETRIVLAVGWGQLYPVCAELNDECWSRNRLVRLSYSPN